MDISNIIYYSQQDDKRKTLSLRDLHLKKDDNYGLHTIFYTARDAVDAQDLFENLQKICYEHIEFDRETQLHIRFKVFDDYGDFNYLKFKKN